LLYSVDLNLRYRFGHRYAFLAGFRMVELDEHLDIVGVSDALDIDILDVQSYNRMYGFQIGTDVALWDDGKGLRIDSVCKVGLYGNRAGQTSVDVVGWLTPTPGGRLTDKGSDVAVLSELWFTATCYIFDWLAVRAGYQMMWIEGVALATDQLDDTDLGLGTVSLDTDGGVFYHGASVGLEAVW